MQTAPSARAGTRSGRPAEGEPEILGRTVVGGVPAVLVPEATFRALTAGIPEAEIRAALAPTPPPRRDRPGPIPDRLLSEAMRRRQIIEAVEAHHRSAGNISRTQAIADVARQRKVSSSSIRGWLKRVAGKPYEEREAALIPAWNGQPPSAVDDAAVTFLRTLRLRPERPSIAFCYRETIKAARANGWGRVPALRTLQRRGLIRLASPGFNERSSDHAGGC